MRFIAAIAKLVLSLGLLALIVSRIDASSLPTLLLESKTSWAIVITTMALLLQGILAGWRQIDIVMLLGSRLTMFGSLRVWFVGLFINQVGLTFIASDVMRALQLMQEGVPRLAAGRAVVLDRIIGLGVLLLMIDAVLPIIAKLTENAALKYGLFILVGLSTSGLLCLLAAGFVTPLLTKLPDRVLQHRLFEICLDLISVSRFFYTQPARSLRIATLSFVMHLLNVAALVWIARALNADASPWAMAVVIIPVMFLSMLPISIAGWGVREAAAATALSLLQVPTQIALTASVGFGLSSIIASLPGILVLLTPRPSQKLPTVNALASIRSPEHLK